MYIQRTLKHARAERAELDAAISALRVEGKKLTLIPPDKRRDSDRARLTAIDAEWDDAASVHRAANESVVGTSGDRGSTPFLRFWRDIMGQAPDLRLHRAQLRAFTEADWRELRDDYEASEAMIRELRRLAADVTDDRGADRLRG